MAAMMGFSGFGAKRKAAWCNVQVCGSSTFQLVICHLTPDPLLTFQCVVCIIMSGVKSQWMYNHVHVHNIVLFVPTLLHCNDHSYRHLKYNHTFSQSISEWSGHKINYSAIDRLKTNIAIVRTDLLYVSRYVTTRVSVVGLSLLLRWSLCRESERFNNRTCFREITTMYSRVHVIVVIALYLKHVLLLH